MSNVTGFLTKLLNGAEVDWIPMGDERVGTFTRGGGLQKKDFVESGVGCIHYGQIYTHYGTYARTTKSFVSNEFAKKARMASPGDVVIATTSENDEDVCKAVAWLGDEKIAVSSDACFYSHKLNPKFVSYFFQSEQFQKQKAPYITGTKVRRVNADGLAKILIPIPCHDDPEKSLAIQGEIVRILDSFTELTAELTAELSQRKKQYNYYRDQLLSHPSGNMAWKPLGWVGEVRMCKRVMKNQTSDAGDIPFFKIGTFGREPDAFIPRALFDEFRKKYSYPKIGDVLISASGTIGRVVVFDGEEAYFQDSNIVWLENDESRVLNKYLFYFYQIAKWYVSDGGVIKRLYNDNIKKTLVAVPYPDDPEKSLEEQARIVAILDTFNTLTTSLTEGLPREIALREKQYAYYRDLLLSFPKPDEMAA